MNPPKLQVEPKGFIFDLDGTVYLGEKLIPEADRTILALRDRGKKVVFLSNKPLYARQDYARKLTGLGIPTEAGEVINSSYVLARYLATEAPGASLFVVGEPRLIEELAQAGFGITENPREVDYVVAAFDRTFTYAKLNTAFQAIRLGARFVATNQDKTCPFEGGEIPDCAGMIAAIEAVTDHQVEAVVGKPSAITTDIILEKLDLEPAECLMIGDRLATDIAMGQRCGMATALVLTGVTGRADLARSRFRPDFVLESVADLLPVLGLREAAGAGA